MPTDDMKPNPAGELKFSKWYVYQTLKHKKIVAVDLRDPAQEIEEFERFRAIKKLDFISNEIARRQFTHDTSSVFKIELGRESTYGDFVWVLNLTRLYRPEPAARKQPSQWELFKVAFAEWWETAILAVKKSFIYFLGFILLIIIPAVIRLSKTKRRQSSAEVLRVWIK